MPVRSSRIDPTWSLAGLALALYLGTALFSLGFYHYDEHFQILELASFRLGRTPEADLAWEYAARVRPWLQPAFYGLIARAWRACGVENPFLWAASFRVASAVLAWTATLAMLRLCARWFDGQATRRRASQALALACFLPYLAARTSSENMGGTLLFLGLAIVVGGATPLSWKRGLAAGTLLGLAFGVRYQMAFAIGGLVAWCRLMAGIPASRLARLLPGVAASLALGALADRWGYGAWTATPWHYFRVNLIEHGAAEFGVQPFWQYAVWLGTALPPIGGLVLVGVLAGFILRWRHVLTWTMAPFLLGHLLLAHKEPRFLFPMALGAIVLSLLAWDRFVAWRPRASHWLSAHGARWAYRALVAINVGWLVFLGLSPAALLVSFYQRLASAPPAHCALLALGVNPYAPVADLRFNFYVSGLPRFEVVGSTEALARALMKADGCVCVAHRGVELPRMSPDFPSRCRRSISALPAWLAQLDVADWPQRASWWSLSCCDPAISPAAAGAVVRDPLSGPVPGAHPRVAPRGRRSVGERAGGALGSGAISSVSTN